MNIPTRVAAVIHLILLGGIVASSLYLYPTLPAQIASHWNTAGEADGYTPKNWSLFFFPTLMAGIWLLSIALPKIDPLRTNLEKFRGPYDFFFVALNLFFAYLFILSMAWNLGSRFNFGQMLTPALAALVWAISLLIQHSKRNWFVGIRTPWTMQSDHVWDKTHRLGALLFKLSALAILVGAFFPAFLLWFIFVPITATALITIVYSYIEFSREVR